MTKDPREPSSMDLNDPQPRARSIGDKLQEIALVAPEKLRAIEAMADLQTTALVNKLHRILVMQPEAIHTIEALLDRLLEPYEPKG